MDAPDLKKKTAHSVMWVIIRTVTLNVISFFVFAMLARLLSPHEFGVFALSFLILEVSTILAAAGLSDAIMREKEFDPILADTLFWANIALGIVLGATLYLITPLYVMLVDEPEVAPILHWMAILTPISSIGGIHTALTFRDFGYKAFAARQITANIIAGFAAVAAAMYGYGVWSLVIRNFIADSIGVVFAWQTYPAWKPSFRFDPERLWRVLWYGCTMTLNQLLWKLIGQIQNIFIARFISVAAVGLYSIAWRLLELITQSSIKPISDVSVISLSRVQGDDARFENIFLRMLGLGALILFPAFAGFGVLSVDLMVLLFGEKWEASAELAQVLALCGVPLCIEYFINSALASTGHSSTIAKNVIIQAVTALILTPIGAYFGLYWVAVAFVARTYLTLPYYMFMFRRDTGVSMTAIFKAVTPPLVASAMMLAILLVVAPFLHTWLDHGVIFVAIMTVIGGIAFGGSLLSVSRSYVRNFMTDLKLLRGVAT